jgi:hypothetical protein
MHLRAGTGVRELEARLDGAFFAEDITYKLAALPMCQGSCRVH